MVKAEDFVEVVDSDTILVAGTQIGIEAVLADYLAGVSPMGTVFRHPTLTMYQVYAVIAYYIFNQAEVEAYLRRRRLAQKATQQAQAEDEDPSEMA